MEITSDFARRDDCLDKMVPSDLRTLVAELERLRLEVAKRREIMNRSPFCPDHRDKVAGLPCRECEIERLRSLLTNMPTCTLQFKSNKDLELWNKWKASAFDKDGNILPSDADQQR